MKTSLHLAIAFMLLSGFAQAQSPNATIAGRLVFELEAAGSAIFRHFFARVS